MSVVYHYMRPHRLDTLYDELVEADLAPILLQGSGNDIWVTEPDGTSEPAVRAVVNAHNPAIKPPHQQVDEAAWDQLDEARVQIPQWIEGWATLDAATKDTVLLETQRTLEALLRAATPAAQNPGHGPPPGGPPGAVVLPGP